MKKLSLVLVFALAFVLFVPVASAKEFSNAEKNVGNVVSAPFKIVGKAWSAIWQKPTGILAVPKVVRQETFNGLESTGRLVSGSKALAPQAQGAANTAITEAGLDWLVDGILYGTATGVLWWNEAGAMTPTLCEQAWTAGAATGVGVALFDAVDAATE